MNRLFRLYNQNRHMFWIIVFTVIIVIALIQALNNRAKEIKRISSSRDATTYSEIIASPNYSVITRENCRKRKSKL